MPQFSHLEMWRCTENGVIKIRIKGNNSTLENFLKMQLKNFMGFSLGWFPVLPAVCWNPSCSFCVILQTNWPTDGNENTNFFHFSRFLRRELKTEVTCVCYFTDRRPASGELLPVCTGSVQGHFMINAACHFDYQLAGCGLTAPAGT